MFPIGYPLGAQVQVRVLDGVFHKYNGMYGTIIHKWVVNNGPTSMVWYQIRIQFYDRVLILELDEFEVTPA